MRNRLASAIALIADARDQVAGCLDAPNHCDDIWAAASRDLAEDWRYVGDNLRTAMDLHAADLGNRPR